MRITELARQAGVRTSAIRFYERAGLLPPPVRSANGYREYLEADAVHIRFLKRGQELGFTLTELGEFAALTGGQRAAADVTNQVRAKIDEIDERIDDLQRTRAALVEVAERPTSSPAAVCPVVEALGSRLAVRRGTRA